MIAESRKQLINQSMALMGHPENWDGNGASPPTAETVREAIRFIVHLPDNIPTPVVCLSTEGAIHFNWGLPGFSLDVSVAGGYGYWYLAESEHEPHEYSSDEWWPCNISLNDVIVSHLLAALAEGEQ